jgi:Flp pilus assembly protein TadD
MTYRSAALGLVALLAACGHSDDSMVLRKPDLASRLDVAATAAASGQTDLALSMYAAAASAAPDNVEVQTKLARLLLKVGKPEMAGEILTRALGRKPNDPTLLRWSGVVLLETGETNQAAQIFDKVLARNPRDVGALNGRGMALDLADRHDEAQQAYRTALAIAPNDVQTANNLAISLLLADRPTEARDLLQPLAQRPDVPSRVLNNLAIADAASGDLNGSNALLAGRPGADDIRTLATAFGAPSTIAPPPGPPQQGETPSHDERPAG